MSTLTLVSVHDALAHVTSYARQVLRHMAYSNRVRAAIHSCIQFAARSRLATEHCLTEYVCDPSDTRHVIVGTILILMQRQLYIRTFQIVAELPVLIAILDDICGYSSTRAWPVTQRGTYMTVQVGTQEIAIEGIAAGGTPLLLQPEFAFIINCEYASLLYYSPRITTQYLFETSSGDV